MVTDHACNVVVIQNVSKNILSPKFKLRTKRQTTKPCIELINCVLTSIF